MCVGRGHGGCIHRLSLTPRPPAQGHSRDHRAHPGAHLRCLLSGEQTRLIAVVPATRPSALRRRKNSRTQDRTEWRLQEGLSLLWTKEEKRIFFIRNEHELVQKHKGA